MEFRSDHGFALEMDNNDPLRDFRKRFIIPKRGGAEQIYFLGNSLGLQPANARDELDKVLNQWADFGVEGFFHGDEPWMNYHEKLIKPLATIVGAQPSELVVMNQLTVNLHLMMVSFYKPEGKRNKIICESKAFPSDQYMLETHIKYLGLDPAEIIIEVPPRPGEFHIRHEDVLKSVADHRDELAMVLWGGVNYYTGQVFDMKAIAMATHEAGALIGLDLAHAAGNIELSLHDWDIDFACWCSYKYLNSGPGAIGGAFINARFHHEGERRRFAGWWGHEKSTRFNMEKGFRPVESAEGWQLSTPSILLYATHHAALKIFQEAGIKRIFEKARLMTSYLFFLLNSIMNDQTPNKITILTPQQDGEHGSQVSMFFREDGRLVFDRLTENGIFADWREPGVIRIAPVPLYNSFGEIYSFADCLRKALQ
ncbi:MAG: kynureninase [Chitinophagaceae bacterium]|nr:MAG: kynureninase [Chitinophagaceae bacterium]